MDLFEILLAKKLGGNGGGGITPSGTKDITANGNDIDVYSYAKVNVNVPNPSTGKVNITTTSEVNVTDYATAQVVDSDLIASNIKKDVNILGVTGTYEGGGGGGIVEENDVNFYDYDGTLLYSYSARDFANLSAMPRNPSHTGLTAQGWNWSLVDAKAYVALSGFLDIGQSYVTDNGRTRLYIDLDDPNLLNFDLYLRSMDTSSTYRIHWGDGTTNDSTSSSTSVTYSHTYSTTGNYCIELEALTGSFRRASTTTGWSILGKVSDHYAQATKVKKIEIGNNFRMYADAFQYLTEVKSITIPKTLDGLTIPRYLGFSNTDTYFPCKCCIVPDGVTASPSVYGSKNMTVFSIPNNVVTIGSIGRAPLLKRFATPTTLTTFPSVTDTLFSLTQYNNRKVYIPSNFTVIPQQMFQYNIFKRCVIPEGIQSIGSAILSNAINMEYLSLPSTLTECKGAIRSKAHSLTEIHIYATTPPTCSATLFTELPSVCKIYVPSASLTTYQSASKWSDFSSKMIGE